jgi:hypothetical protein
MKKIIASLDLMTLLFLDDAGLDEITVACPGGQGDVCASGR